MNSDTHLVLSYGVRKTENLAFVQLDTILFVGGILLSSHLCKSTPKCIFTLTSPMYNSRGKAAISEAFLLVWRQTLNNGDRGDDVNVVDNFKISQIEMKILILYVTTFATFSSRVIAHCL